MRRKLHDLKLWILNNNPWGKFWHGQAEKYFSLWIKSGGASGGERNMDSFVLYHQCIEIKFMRDDWISLLIKIVTKDRIKLDNDKNFIYYKKLSHGTGYHLRIKKIIEMVVLRHASSKEYLPKKKVKFYRKAVENWEDLKSFHARIWNSKYVYTVEFEFLWFFIAWLKLRKMDIQNLFLDVEIWYYSRKVKYPYKSK